MQHVPPIQVSQLWREEMQMYHPHHCIPEFYLLQDCDFMRRIYLSGVRWKQLKQMQIIHPIQKHLPLPALSSGYGSCMASREGDMARGDAIKKAMNETLQRSHYMDWWDYPSSDRSYYKRKWGDGGEAEPCSRGDKLYPFGDIRNPLSRWDWNQTMRDEIMAVSGLDSEAPR